MNCSGPPVIENGYVSYTSLDDIAVGGFKNSTVATYECFKYYALVDSSSLTCNNGQWTGTTPGCEYSRKTEIVFWTCVALLSLLLLLLLLLIIFLCCYFCRCCKGCCRGSQDDECDIERLRNHSSAGSMHSHRSPESNRSSQNNRYIRREHSNGECCAGCCRPGSKHRMSSRQNQIAPEHGQSEKKECCTGCCSNGKQTRTDTPRRRNDDNTNCCVGCCGGTKTSKSPTPRRVERDRSRTTTTTVQSNVMEHNEDRKSGCCACCSTSEMKTQETKRTDSDRTLFTPKHRERTETRSKVQDVQDDNERVDSGCLCGCKKKTYREHYTEDRYSVSQGENYEANIRSEAPSSLGYSGTSKLNAKRNEEEKAFEEEMERLERENKVKNERQKEIQRQQQMEISLLQEKESRRLKQKQMELEDEQRRLRKEELQKKREEQEREEQRRRMEEKERERRERIAQREERKRELEQSRQRSLVMSEEIADVEEEYMPSNYHIKPKKTRPKAPIRARYLDVFNKNDPSIYGRPRAVHQKVFWRPSKNPIRYPNQSTM